MDGDAHHARALDVRGGPHLKNVCPKSGARQQGRDSRDFLLCVGSLERQQPTVGIEQGSGPQEELFQTRNRPASDNIELLIAILSAQPLDPDIVQVQFLDGFREKSASSQERLDQCDVQVRPNNGQWDTRQTRSGSNIRHIDALTQYVQQRKRV